MTQSSLDKTYLLCLKNMYHIIIYDMVAYSRKVAFSRANWNQKTIQSNRVTTCPHLHNS